jgi:hypothetical protein
MKDQSVLLLDFISLWDEKHSGSRGWVRWISVSTVICCSDATVCLLFLTTHPDCTLYLCHWLKELTKKADEHTETEQLHRREPDSNFARNSSCAPFQYHENRATLTFSWLVLQEQNMRFSIWRGLRLKKLPILGIGSLGSTAVPLLRNFWLTRRLLLTCCVPPVMRFSAEWWIPRFLKSHHYFFSKGQKFTHRRWWQTVQLNRLNRGDGWGFTRSGQSSS